MKWHKNLLQQQFKSKFTLLEQLARLTSQAENTSHFAAKQHDEPLQMFCQWAQAHWLRPQNKERWELQDSPQLEHSRLVIWNLLEQLGFIENIKPAWNTVDYVLIFGASNEDFWERLNYLAYLWNHHFRFKKLFILTGGFIPQNLPKTFNLNQTSLQTDTEWMLTQWQSWQAQVGGILGEVEAILTCSLSGESKDLAASSRPTTADTLINWLARQESGQKVVCISNQPYIGYQGMLAQRLLGPHYQTSTVGPACRAHTPLRLILDAFARLLYELIPIEKC